MTRLTATHVNSGCAPLARLRWRALHPIALGAGLALAMLQPGLGLAAGEPAAAQLYQGADTAEGERLIAQHRCTACHQGKVGGDGSAIYRPRGRISTPAMLRGMVEQCNTELNLAMFPEEVTSVSAVLNRDHYHFR